MMSGMGLSGSDREESESLESNRLWVSREPVLCDVEKF